MLKIHFIYYQEGEVASREKRKNENDTNNDNKKPRVYHEVFKLIF